jgi:hypothetical protein
VKLAHPEMSKDGKYSPMMNQIDFKTMAIQKRREKALWSREVIPKRHATSIWGATFHHGGLREV